MPSCFAAAVTALLGQGLVSRGPAPAMAPSIQRQAALLCAVTLFGVYSVRVILAQDSANVQRDLGCVELWSGVGAVAQAAQEAGEAAATFDKVNCESQDITTIAGFKAAVNLVLRLREGGLLWMGPECSSFTFAPVSVTARSQQNNYNGDVTKEFVARGNLMANIAALLFCLGIARGAEVALENPAGSYMFSYLEPALACLRSPGLPALPTCCVDRCSYCSPSTPANENFKKKYKFLSSSRWILAVAKQCNCGAKPHVPLMEKSATGVTGVKHRMKKSQEYPKDLGTAIIKAWQHSGSNELQDNRSPFSLKGQGVQVKSLPSTCAVKKPRVKQSKSEAEVFGEEDPWADCKATPRKSSSRSNPWAEVSSKDAKPSSKRALEDTMDDPWSEMKTVHIKKTRNKTSATASTPAFSEDNEDPWSEV